MSRDAARLISRDMEDAIKVSSRRDALVVDVGGNWIATELSTTVYNVDTLESRELKVFICEPSGEVREYPYTDYLV